jgi:hypothetical protein
MGARDGAQHRPQRIVQATRGAGVVTASEHAKLKAITDLSQPGKTLTFNHDQMHSLFVHVKRSIGRLILEHTGHLPGAPDADSIVGIAISNHR